MSVEYVPLRYVTSVLARGTAPNYVDDGPIRMISQAANQDSGLDWERTRFHDFAGDPRKLKGYLEPGDSLVNSTGTGTLGRIGWFEKSPDARPCVADGHVTVTRFDPTRVDKRFGFYYLKSDEFQEFMFETLVNGSTNQIELSRERMSAVSMPVPPLEEQRRIADFLDAETTRIDQLVSMFRRARELLDERRSARRDGLLDHLRSDYGEIPLRRFMLRVDQGDSPQCDAVPRDVGEWGVLKLSAVKAGRFNPEENKRLPDDIPVNRANQIHAGDFLITRANTPSLVGDAAVAAGDVAGLLLPDLIYRVRLDRGANAEFLVQVVLGRRVRNLIEAVARGSSQSMVKLRGEDIKQWPIPRVGQRQQGEVVRMIHEASSETERLQHRIMRQIDLMSERRQALITAAVTGEFDVSAASGRGIEE